MILEEAPPIANKVQPPLIDLIRTTDGRLDMAVMYAKVSTGDWVVHQKGGHAHEPHAHLDSGSFTLRIGEDTWLSDLGRFNYPAGDSSKNSYWAMPTEPMYEGGLSYFRKNDLSHNLVTLTGRPLNTWGRARIISHREGLNPSDGARFGQVVWDTTTLYTPVFESSKRIFTLTERGRFTTLDITDEFSNPATFKPGSSSDLATWRVVTCGNRSQDLTGEKSDGIDISARTTAKLIRPDSSSANSPIGQKSEPIALELRAQILEPSTAVFSKMMANPEEELSLKVGSPSGPQSQNEGCSILAIPLKGAHVRDLAKNSRGIRVTVRFQRYQ